MKQDAIYYVYALLDPRKNGRYTYGEYSFEFEPIYIGKGSGKRCEAHVGCDLKRGYNSYKDNKIKKILNNGLVPIIIKIAEELDEKTAFLIEIDAINIIGRKSSGGPLTNIYEGGMGSKKSEETKKKISATKKRQYANGEITHHFLGKPWSAEMRDNILKAKRGKDYSWTDDQKNSLTVIRCNRKNPSQTEQWKVTNPNGEEIIVYGLGEFCRNNQLNQGHMWSVAAGKRSHHKGWVCSKVVTDSNAPLEPSI